MFSATSMCAVYAQHLLGYQKLQMQTSRLPPAFSLHPNHLPALPMCLLPWSSRHVGKELKNHTLQARSVSAGASALSLSLYWGNGWYSNWPHTLRGDTASFSPAWLPFNFGNQQPSWQVQTEVGTNSRSWESHENVNHCHLNSKLSRHLSGQIQICKSQEDKRRERATALKISTLHPA